MPLLWDYEWNRVDPAAFALTHLLDDPTMLVVAVDHPLAGGAAAEVAMHQVLVEVAREYRTRA